MDMFVPGVKIQMLCSFQWELPMMLLDRGVLEA